MASRRSVGAEVSFGDKVVKCRDLESFDFKGIDFCLMSAGSAVSKEWSPRIGAQGTIVIDNSSAWRYDQDVPLIVPEVNGDAIRGFTKKNIIANPNCSTAQLVVTLKPLHDAAKINRVVVSTYQSVSGAGKDAMDELWHQTKGKYVPGQEIGTEKVPEADRLQLHSSHRRLHGGRLHERGMEDAGRDQEDSRSEDQANGNVRARAGVRRSLGICQHPVRESDQPEEAREILRAAPGVEVIDKREPGGYITPVEAAGEFSTFVSRIREDSTVENGLAMWIVSDNLLKGAALNAVQIAETLIHQRLVPKAA